MKSYIEQYKLFYENGGYGNASPVLNAKDKIKLYIEKTNSKSLLDYGAGEGIQYSKYSLDTYWKVSELFCYDPGVAKYAIKPIKTYDAVISTDVLEHIPEFDLDNVLSDIFRFGEKLIYLQIATSPSIAVLPNGENAHCTLKTHTEWTEIIYPYKAKNQIVILETWGKSKGFTEL